MYERLSKCKFVVGINSTLFIEAISLGAFPFVYKTDFYKDMECLYHENNSIIFNNSKELSKKIMNFKDNYIINRNKFFSSYSEDNTRALVNDSP